MAAAPAFNELLHDLRGEGLRRMPPGAETFLSAGCAGGWYFAWIAENYPGIRRHIGVERYSAKPADLPENAQWISNSVSDMHEVASDSVDLLFSGQNIEHVRVHEIGPFLREARRVLRAGAWLVMDSPNRAMTERTGWTQPEHVLEFRVDEIKDVVELAGFDVESIHGLWQCYDVRAHKLLPLDPSNDDAANRRRIDDARGDPENAFVWWLTARRGTRAPDWPALDARLQDIAREALPMRATRFKTQVGTFAPGELSSEARGARGRDGYLLYGPYIPLFPGRYRAVFRIRALESPGALARWTRARLGHVDIASFHQKRDIARRDFSAADLATPGEDGYCAFAFDFELRDALFGAEFRVHTTGRAALGAAVPVQVDRVS
ncbi:MAG TPA: methyltransferase domain-containing protein [Casimicrobiaceae bacterium]|jgi:SAM-dependent methyltransferase